MRGGESADAGPSVRDASPALYPRSQPPQSRTRMANLNAVLKDEINRIARKVVRSQVQALKSSGSSHRRSIAKLKKEVLALRRELGVLRRSGSGSRAASSASASEGTAVRFSG